MARDKTFFTALFVIIFFPYYAAAEDKSFYDNEADIINILSQPVSSESAIKTRGLTRGFTRNDASRSVGNKRTIVVMTEQDNQMIPQTVTVSGENNIPKVNMKIQFDCDSSALSTEAYPLLRELGRALSNQALAGKRISLLGHTDSDGSAQYNLRLSLKRAKSVKNYLVGNFNLSPSRINIYGYGETHPLFPNSSTYNKHLNRRVEIRAE